MAAFNDLDWRRLDVWAIVAGSGLATLDEGQYPFCRDWLARNDYQVDTLDCSDGLGPAIVALGQRLEWESRFGYRLEAGSRNLDALSDGFEFEVPEDGGRVFQIIHADTAWHEDSRWFLGLLAIAQERSHWHLALGRRFFTLLVLPQYSPLIGTVIDQIMVPAPFTNKWLA